MNADTNWDAFLRAFREDDRRNRAEERRHRARAHRLILLSLLTFWGLAGWAFYLIVRL